MKIGELVRCSEDGNYGDKRWAGALAIVVGDVDNDYAVKLRRLSDGLESHITRRVIERYEEPLS